MNKYLVNTSSHLVLHRLMKKMDFNLILRRLGKALGMIA